MAINQPILLDKYVKNQLVVETTEVTFSTFSSFKYAFTFGSKKDGAILTNFSFREAIFNSATKKLPMYVKYKILQGILTKAQIKNSETGSIKE
jgi:hypothetical protein